MISALELARRLAQPQPTAQQQAVIEAPLSPALVTAGAGSGKTSTMANRVVWLIANELIRPDQVLGLTFTRKAAGSLSDRIAKGILALRDSSSLNAEAAVEFDQPTVSTYNSFASALFRDHALLIGREPESALLNEAAAWQLARRVVVASTDDRLVALEQSVDNLAEWVLNLAHAISDNDADPSEVAGFGERFAAIAELPYTAGKPKPAPYVSVTTAVAQVAALAPLTELAIAFAREKKRLGLLEFSDQVALALEVVSRSEAVRAEYRERYRVVLLDEYQDTSVVQTRLLSALFADTAVMAVGDPHQSIYGWRGASAANLARFAADFTEASTATTFSLSVSWRNATTILDAANVLVAPLTALGGHTVGSPLAVAALEARPAAPVGAVTGWYFEEVTEEADGVAKWFKTQLADGGTENGADGLADSNPKSAAILFRQRRQMTLFASALAEHGVPHHILGIGGLLSTPEIVDLVSALRVIHDPTAGSPLVRLLGGARWAIGPRDLRQLAQLAGWLQDHDWAQQRLSDEVRERMRNSVAADGDRSIVDALDFVGEAPPTHSQLVGFSEEGLERLRAAATQLAYLRSRAGLPLTELVRLVTQELLLDIEVVANETSGLGMANLYAFEDELVTFVSSDEQATLGAFLAWLDRAERQDMMGPRSEAEEPGTVQLLTIHGSKGLEWDVVAVPRMVSEELPAKSREGAGWLRAAELPYEFRGDFRELPVLDWRGVANQHEFDMQLKIFKQQLADRHAGEERRLGYVAVTRARDALLLTGAFWSTQSRPREPGAFLLELAAQGLIDELPTESQFEENPQQLGEHAEPWPLDPLGRRRESLEQSASLVRAKIEAIRGAGPDACNTGGWHDDIELLLAERASARGVSEVVALPKRIAASRFKDFVSDAAAVALALRRPLPERPYRATRLGTRFHSWVENRYGMPAPSDTIDALESELDGGADFAEAAGADDARLEALIATFERSPWADRLPIDVEIELHLPFDGQIVVCKIDAVYAHGDRFEIVDWKTGQAPRDAADLERKQLQLALYRLAYAQWKAIEIEQIDAAFYFVADDEIIRPERLFSEAELIARWRAALG